MRFFKSFRLLHRRTKSEGDVTAVLTAQSATQTACRSFSVQRPDPPNMTGESDSFSVDTINLTPPINELPFFDPIDLYAPLPYVTSHFFPLIQISPNSRPNLLRYKKKIRLYKLI